MQLRDSPSSPLLNYISLSYQYITARTRECALNLNVSDVPTAKGLGILDLELIIM